MAIRTGSTLPTFDWSRVVRRLPGLLGLVHPDGRIVSLAGRLFDDCPDMLELTHVTQLAAEEDAPRLEMALQLAAAEQRAVCLRVRSQQDRRRYAVEVSPEQGATLLIAWVGADRSEIPDTDDEIDLDQIATPMAAGERSAAPPRRLSEPTLPAPAPSEESARRLAAPTAPTAPAMSPSGPASRALPPVLPATFAPPVAPEPDRPPLEAGVLPEYVIVAPSGLRRLASRMQRTVDLVSAHNAVWFAEEFDTKRSKLSGHTRVMFLGPSKYADFMKRLVKPQFEAAGAHWGMMERKVLFWVSESAEEEELAKKLEAAYNKAGKGSASVPGRVPGTGPLPSGKDLAAKFLNEVSPVRPGLIEQRYLLGIAMFLLDGFAKFHAAPPSTGAGSSSGGG